MGLIKTAETAIKSTLKDQWKEVIRCDNMSNDVLMVKVSPESGIISNKSTIIVAPGQCAIIYDNGKVIDATAEEGIYVFDESSSPSFFAGQFGAVFKEMWERFTYEGAISKEQYVFFFNIKEIIDNKFGTPAPIPFQDWSHPIPNQMTGTLNPLRVEIKCFGKYTFRIADLAIFMNKMAGTANIYRKDDLVEQIRSEVIASFQNVLNELGTSEFKVPVLELPSQTDEIREIMNERVFDKPIRERGIELVSFSVESVTLDEESEKKIDKYEFSSNSYMQQGALVDAYANAVQDAANNSAGSLNGVMGIGVMNMASNGMLGGIAQAPWQQNNGASQQPIENKKEDTWTCSNCKKEINGGKFCPECGTKREEKAFCKECGKELSSDAKFCPECGTKC
ncbi:MAG: zinc-ribbon domain-containing protein [Clostridiales bacterium]|nr:zinc-ribbon domain-containing protein [Clostridiales bacterium]